PDLARANPSHTPSRCHLYDAVLDRNACPLPRPRHAEASADDFDLDGSSLNYERSTGGARSHFANDSTAIEHDQHAMLGRAPEHDRGLGLDIQRQTLKGKV